MYLWCKLLYPALPDKRGARYRNFPDILKLFLICILVYIAVPLTDLTIRLVTSYPVQFSMAHFMYIRCIGTHITWLLRMYVCMYLCTCACMYYVYVYVCTMYVHIYIYIYIHSFTSLSYDRSKTSSKASCPHSAIYCFLLQIRASSPFLKVI